MTVPAGEQVVVVTGASSGVGRAIARAFGRRGAKVGLIARNEEALEHAAAEIRGAGGEALVLPCDVSEAQALEAAADAVERHWGRIDTWINDAMVSVFAPVLETTPEEYRRVTEVAYLGYVFGTQSALRRMRARGRGTIIQVGSALAYRSIPLQSAYCASKAAIRGFTDSLRTELIHDRSPVRVCMVHLPAVNTPQFDVVRSRLPRRAQPVPPIYQPEPIAEAVVYASEHPTRELWLGGPTILAVVGQRLIPALLDRYLGRVGYRRQQTDELRSRTADNLDAPMPGDRGAHGRFDRRARRFTPEIWLRTHPRALAGAALALAAVGLGTRALRGA
jgi:NAD(P)-dependent dehydrogenase (short-subunit alcohol dehydrogenase family)